MVVSAPFGAFPSLPVIVLLSVCFSPEWPVNSQLGGIFCIEVTVRCLWTIMNFTNFVFFSNIFELCAKCFEHHDYAVQQHCCYCYSYYYYYYYYCYEYVWVSFCLSVCRSLSVLSCGCQPVTQEVGNILYPIDHELLPLTNVARLSVRSRRACHAREHDIYWLLPHGGRHHRIPGSQIWITQFPVLPSGFSLTTDLADPEFRVGA